MTMETTGGKTSRLLRYTLAMAAGFGILLLDEHLANGPSFTSAQAVIGRPLTPMSYAGVARRTTRRAAYAGAGAAYGAYAAPPAYAAAPYAQTCTQTTDAYGRVYTTC
jgi:hypothetical protein